MKKYSLLFISLLATSYVRADDFNGNAPLFPGESWTWLNLNLVLFAGGFFLFLYIVRRLYDARLRHQNRNAPVAKALTRDNIYEPRYWYQCKHCRATIRKDSPPNKADCFKAVDHLWTEIAEVGKIKYLCKNCNTLIKARSVPVTDNCPEGESHNWQQLQ